MRRSVVSSLAMLTCAFTIFGTGLPALAKVRLTHYHWTAWGPPVLQLLKEMAQDFEKKNPEVKVDIVTNGGWDKLLVMMASGKPPDIFDCYLGGVSMYVQADVLTDLTPYMKRDKLKQADYVKPVYDAFINKGRLYGYPIGYGSVGTIYNKTMLSEVGLASPNSLQDAGKWDWAALVTYGKKLTRDKNGDGKVDVYGIGSAPDIGRYPMWVHQNGKMLFDKSLQPTKSYFQSPEAIEGLKFYYDLFVQHKVTNTNLWWDTIQTAKAAMDVTAFAGTHTWIYSAVGNKIPIDVVEVPKGPKNQGSLFSGNAFHIPKGSKKKEWTWKWIKHLLLSPDSPKRWMAASGKPFALKGYENVYKSIPNFPEHADAYIRMASDPNSLSIYDSSLQDFNATGNILISNLLSGKVSWSQFPGVADKTFDQLFARVKKR